MALGAGLLVFQGSKLLLVKSKLGFHCWGPPKGQLKPEETLWDCALRETLEESGYDFSKIFKEEPKTKIKIRYAKNLSYMFYIVSINRLPEKTNILANDEVFGSDWFVINQYILENRRIFQKITRMCYLKIKNDWIVPKVLCA